MTRTLLAGMAAALAALLLFAALAWGIASQPVVSFDAAVRGAIHARSSPALTYVMRGITELGGTVFIFILSVVAFDLLRRAGRRRAATLFAIAVLGGQVLSETLKLVFHRARPEAFFGYPLPHTYSFPSGHAVAAASFYGVLAAIFTVRGRGRASAAALWTAAAVISLLIGISRIYLGVHYPSDVMAGYAAAVVWVAAVYAAAHRIGRQRE